MSFKYGLGVVYLMLLFHIHVLCIKTIAENISLKCVVLQHSDSDSEVFDLLDPSSSDILVGSIFISCSVEVCSM